MPQEVVARRLGDTVYLQMKVPAKNMSGRGAFSVDRLEIYAVTLAPGAVVPPNRDLLKPAHVVAKIPVRPPVEPDAPEPDEKAQQDTRPRPGDVVTFVEKLTDAELVPQVITKPPKADKAAKAKAPPPAAPDAAPGTPPAAPGAPPAPAGPAVLTRQYTIAGVSRRGERGTPTPRIDIPLLLAPGPARPAPAPTFDETSITISWQPPLTTSDEAPGVLYNVYAVPAAGSGAAGAPLSVPTPLNSKPLDTTSFTQPGAAPDKEQCFVVRSVATVGSATIESDPSDPLCVTPKDTFPPAAPKGVTAVGGSGAVNLIWDANSESDLAGYLVLRGEAPGDRLQPLMPRPIRETRYTDRDVSAGVTYVYVVIAVDKAGNRSAHSNRVQETAR